MILGVSLWEILIVGSFILLMMDSYKIREMIAVYILMLTIYSEYMEDIILYGHYEEAKWDILVRILLLVVNGVLIVVCRWKQKKKREIIKKTKLWRSNILKYK